MKIITNQKLRKFIDQALLDPEYRSPESISGRINHQAQDLPNISADSIERYLKSPYGRQIEYHRSKMRNKRKYRKKNTKPKPRLGDRVFIDERPEAINNREEVGDVEADFIVSGRDGSGICLTVTDRKIRYSFIERILPVTIPNMEAAFERIKSKYPELSSITTDNDLLFQKYKQLERILGVPIYFCHPYSSWEKGTIENVNGVIRGDIPKGSDISKYSLKYIQNVESKLNNRYLKCIDFKTPQEKLDEYRKEQKDKLEE